MDALRERDFASTGLRPSLGNRRQQLPSNIFAGVQEGRLVVQDLCRFPDSVEWQLGQRYFRERGAGSFVTDTFPVPFAVNGDGNLSLKAARLLFASLLEADENGTLEPDIVVLELGIGLGLFAGLFLNAFQEYCEQQGRDYYDRLLYVAGDYSERMLLDACLNGVFARHPGRYRLRVVNALDPVTDLYKDFELRETGLRVRGVFLNYLLDCLPGTVLRFAHDVCSELYVRTYLARGIKLEDYTSWTLEELADKARSATPAEMRELYEVYALFTSSYDYRPVELDSVPYGDFAKHYAGLSGCSSVWHSYGALQSLDQLLKLTGDGGFILLNEYGQNDPTAAENFEHQRFSHATSLGLNFPELKSYFTQSAGYQWEEPTEETPSIYSRLLGRKVGTNTVAAFRQQFGKEANEAMQEPVQVAHTCLQAGAIDSAATAYRRALEKQPLNWMLMSEAAKFLTFTLKSPEAGAAMSRAALELNPACSAELWNTYGDSLFVLGRVDEARQAFERALRINPGDARAYYNLSFVRQQQKDYAGALEAIAKGLLYDGAGEFREGLLQKQAEIVRYLESRHKQECMLQANRVNRERGEMK